MLNDFLIKFKQFDIEKYIDIGRIQTIAPSTTFK
jgi:hypothetical protein